jgi:hypothetical protein
MSMMTKRKIHNETIAGLIQKSANSLMLPNLFRILKITGRLVPWVGGTDPRVRKAEIEELERRLVDFDYMIEDYYRERALDERGFAKRERLQELGLDDVAEALESIS